MTDEKKIDVNVGVSMYDVACTLCSAFEGGANYWYRIEKKTKPPKFEFLLDQSGPCPSKDPQVYPHIDYPLNEGGSLVVSDYFGVDGDTEAMKKVTLDLEAVKRGLQVMASKYPDHFADMMNENGDACTGDVLLQCCLFGELVYG